MRGRPTALQTRRPHRRSCSHDPQRDADRHSRRSREIRARAHRSAREAFEAAKAYPAELFVELAGLGLMGMTAPGDGRRRGRGFRLLCAGADRDRRRRWRAVDDPVDPEQPHRQRPHQGRNAGAAGALPARPDQRPDDRRLRADGSRGGLGRRRDPHPRDPCPRRLQAERRQAVHHLGPHGRARDRLCGQRPDRLESAASPAFWC